MTLLRSLLLLAFLTLLIGTVLWPFSSVKAVDEDKRLDNTRNLLSGWMATLADEPPRQEKPAPPGVIQEVASLEKNAGPLGGAANLASGLLLWMAERAIEEGEHPTQAQNYHFLLGMREQIPQGGPGVDVVVLGDKESGRAMVCFTLDYYRSQHEEIRKQYPEEKYNVMQSNSPWLNFNHLSPVADSTPVARDSYRQILGPMVGSDTDMKEQKVTYWAADPHPLKIVPDNRNRRELILESDSELKQHQQTYLEPDPRAHMLTIGPDRHPLTIGPAVNLTEYTTEQMQRDIEANKKLAQSIIAYQDSLRGDSERRIGGVALGGHVRFPQGLSPKVLYLAGQKLHVKDGTQDFEIDGVDPSEFAILLRSTVLTERPPALSIGTEPSDKAGYMRVSYFSSIRNSSVGAGMLAADLKLKGLLVGIGLGPGGTASGPSQDFLWTFPPVEGLKSMRLWLVGGDINLDAHDRRLTAPKSNIALHYEMMLRYRPTKDADADRFVAEFNRRWPALTEEIPEFRHLQQLALASALAAWAKESKCIIAPDLWLLPFDYEQTPEYVPAYWSVNSVGLTMVSGGVDLLNRSDFPTPGLGLMMPLVLQRYLWGVNAPDTKGGWIGLALFFLIACLIVFLVAMALRKHLPAISFVSLCRRASGSLLIVFLVLWAIDDIAVSVVNTNAVGSFDAEFTCLIVALLIPPLLLWLVLSLSVKRSGTGTGLNVRALLSLGALTMIALALLSASLGILFSSASASSPLTMRMVNAIGTPMELVSKPWSSSAVGGTGVRILPESVICATKDRFVIPKPEDRLNLNELELGAYLRDDFGSGDIKVPLMDDLVGPPGSTVDLHIVTGPGFISHNRVLTVTGKPPF